MIADVLLVPGLWMPASSMWLLGARLGRAGYLPHLFPYRGRGALEDNVARLAAFARGGLGGAAAHFVGYSLGGLLVLETLNRHLDIPVASAVLLGAPVRGCRAGRKLGRTRVGRWMMGASAPCWEARGARWTRSAPLGVVAGTLPLGLGLALGRLPGANDGVVRVEETAVDGMAGCTLVAQPHSGLPFSARVAALVERFLASGGFA